MFNMNYFKLNIILFIVILIIAKKKLKLSDKLSKLCPTVCHATVCVITSFYYLFYSEYKILSFVRQWSIAYFTYDTLWHVKKCNMLYIIHHMASIIVFENFLPKSINDYDGNLIMVGIFASEIGNFSVYRVNYKIYNRQTISKLDLLIECFAFLVWRNFTGLYMMCLLESNKYRSCVFCFWLVSVWWGLGVAKQFYHKFYIKTIKKNKK